MALLEVRRVSADEWRGVLRPGPDRSMWRRLWRDLLNELHLC
jgi:hypothetical protein